MIKKLVKSFFLVYFNISCRFKILDNLNLSLLKIFYSKPFYGIYIESIANIFQKQIHKIRKTPLIRTVKLVHGFSMVVDVTDTLGGLLYFHKTYSEKNTQQFIKQNIKTDQTFIDIGASYGFFTMLAASLVGEKGRVFSFEANPVVAEMLKKSALLNGFSSIIHVENKAVCNDDNSTVNFYLSTDGINSSIGSLKPEEIMIEHGYLNNSNYILTETISLDKFLEDKFTMNQIMIKIDVEGAESEVLKGMEGILKIQRPQNIIIETSHDSGIIEKMKSFGYVDSKLEVWDKVRGFGNYLFTAQ